MEVFHRDMIKIKNQREGRTGSDIQVFNDKEVGVECSATGC
jgi:hypothetical protein